MKFAEELQHAIKSDDIKKSEMENLSLKIHEAEENGYEISTVEDRLWQQLTEKIMKTK